MIKRKDTPTRLTLGDMDAALVRRNAGAVELYVPEVDDSASINDATLDIMRCAVVCSDGSEEGDAVRVAIDAILEKRRSMQ